MRPFAHMSLIVSGFLLSSAPAFSGYEAFTDIHPAGWTESVAVCINARGDVAGHGKAGQGERGFLWSGGTVTEIVPPGADSARAAWINGNGDIAGTAVAGGVPHAFLLKDGRYLDPTPGWAFSTAVFVGDDGTVAGSGEFGAYISRNGTTEILPGFTAILGANSKGQLIGTKDNVARLYVPDEGYIDLTPPRCAGTFPNAINEAGIVALTTYSDGVQKGFVYSGGWFIQMTPQGWETSQATAVNNLAAVVGFGDYLGVRQSFVRTEDRYAFIAFPSWVATEAVSLNDAGQVTGSGLTASGERHAFVASPAGLAPAQGAAASPALPEAAGGGCAMAPRAASGGSQAGSPVDLAILASPLLVLLGRRVRK